MLNGRARIAICVSMIMSVALIATVVQHSESGIILESDDTSTDAKQLADDLLDPKAIHEKAVADLSRQEKVVNAIVRLRAFCIGTHKQAHEFLESNTKSSESAFPVFIMAFGKPTPTPVKPKAEIRNGIEYPVDMKHVPKAYNVVVEYGRAMGVARGKFTKGIIKYVLDNIDRAINSGTDVITGFSNDHYKNPARVGLDPSAAGLTSRPNYMAKLSAPLEKFSDAASAEAKLANSADVQRATMLLKTGGKVAYRSFLKEAIEKEDARLAAHTKAKVARSEAAIKDQAANPDTDDTFEYVKELSPAGAKANDGVEDVERKSENQLRKEAHEASEEWVKNKLETRKGQILNDQIAKVEANAANKAEADKLVAEAKAVADKKAAAKAVEDKAAADIKAAADEVAKAAADKAAAEKAASDKAKAEAEAQAAEYKAKADADMAKAAAEKAAADAEALKAQEAQMIVQKKQMLAGIKCANEGEPCECSGAMMYGLMDKEGNFHFETKEGASGTTTCDKALTGKDPAPGETKACYCQPM